MHLFLITSARRRRTFAVFCQRAEHDQSAAFITDVIRIIAAHVRENKAIAVYAELFHCCLLFVRLLCA